MDLPLIIGHRGSSAVLPENTIAAFKRSIADGADGIEFDVRLSRDNVPVVIHDRNLARTCAIDKLVGDLDVQDLRSVDAGSWFSRPRQHERVMSDETVPTLEQVFDLFQNVRGVLYLEMKGEPVGKTLPAEVAREIREMSFVDRVVVESFDLRAIEEIKKVAPEIRTAALFDRSIRRPIISSRTILTRAGAVHADEIALHYSLVRDDLVRRAKETGFEVVVWTVEDERWLVRARKLGIKALITNDPAELLRHQKT